MNNNPSSNPFYKRIIDRDMTTPEMVEAARKSCRQSIRNTAVGAWLAAVLERLESEHQNACGRTH